MSGGAIAGTAIAALFIASWFATWAMGRAAAAGDRALGLDLTRPADAREYGRVRAREAVARGRSRCVPLDPEEVPIVLYPNNPRRTAAGTARRTPRR